MLQAVNTELRVARARETALQQNVDQLRHEAQQIYEKEIDYQGLEREVNSNQQMQDTVLTRLKEMGVSGALETNNLRVVEEAQVPTYPIKPQKSREMASQLSWALAGLGLAFCWSVWTIPFAHRKKCRLTWGSLSWCGAMFEAAVVLP
jgi:uncharacterized protein involved in exopolysaccharide biosynthesis